MSPADAAATSPPAARPERTPPPSISSACAPRPPSVAESALPALAPRIRQLAEAHELADRVDLQGDAALKDGDARVEWHNGFMEYSFGAVCDRILDALRASGRGDVEEISARGRHMNG